MKPEMATTASEAKSNSRPKALGYADEIRAGMVEIRHDIATLAKSVSGWPRCLTCCGIAWTFLSWGRSRHRRVECHGIWERRRGGDRAAGNCISGTGIGTFTRAKL